MHLDQEKPAYKIPHMDMVLGSLAETEIHQCQHLMASRLEVVVVELEQLVLMLLIVARELVEQELVLQ
jgi:hypothetical protein